MEFHLTMREQQLMDLGIPADEARSRARREFGNRLLLEEAMTDSWRYSTVKRFIQDLRSDVRYAARSLSRSPGFAAAAIVTIALGVGVNAGIFTVLNGVLFRDLPSPDAHELVSIDQAVAGLPDYPTTGGSGTFSTAEYRAYRDGSQTLSGVLGASFFRETTLGGEAPQEIFGAIVSCNYFAVLQQPPVLGRALTAQDCEPGAAPVVVLGHGLWTAAFGTDPEVLGRTIELNRQRFTVIGVAAEDTYGGLAMRTGYFAPISTEPLLEPGTSRYENDTWRWLALIGRRSDGASLGQVRAELGVIAAQIDQLDPGRSTKLTIERAAAMAGMGPVRGLATGAAAVLMAAFGLILLIACANVANLFLARGITRSQEIGIRLSLGASRARVVRQLLTESMLISIAGGLLGTLLALWSFQALVARALPGMVHPEIPGIVLDLNLSPDFWVLSYALTLTLGTGLLFGLAPALHVSRPDLNAVIKQEVVAGAGSRRRGGRLRGTLVGVQVALSMTLMIAAGLLLRGLYATYTVDPGFAYRDVAHLSFGTNGSGGEILDQRFMDEVEALPGVEAAAYASLTPLGEANTHGPIRLPGESENEARFAGVDEVTPGYFSVLEIPIIRGRAFTEAESADAERQTGLRPAIVSETTARNLWGEGDPIGRTLLWMDSTLQVVGVAADARLSALGEIDPYYIYIPRRTGGVLLVKSRASFATTAAGILALVRARDRTLAVRVLPLEANLAFWRGVSGIVTTLGAGLGVLALVLASVGVYGVVAYAVTRRYREIGIRMALGAGTGIVLRMILGQTLRPVVIGAVIGVAAASALSRVLTSVLFGVSPADPVGLGGSALLVLGVALAAGVMAARPATRTDPTATLRHE
jgi:predicted permease